MAAGLGALAGCSSDEDKCLPGDQTCSAAGTGGTSPVGGGGTGGTGGSTGGTGGTPGGGGTGGAAPVGNLGPALTINGGAVSSTEAGISGNVFLISSPNNTATTTRGADTTKLCVNGSVGIVTGTPPDYTNNYGMEFGFGLSDAPAPGGGGGAADAGADAGDAGAAAPPPAQSQAWDPGSIVGFSFKVEGTTIPALIRFKVQPFGAPVDPPFCVGIQALTSGSTRAFRFSEVTSACYNGPGGLAATAPFQNIAWQVPADVTAAHDYDFCVSDIQPILP
jgi:hypothetical protein